MNKKVYNKRLELLNKLGEVKQLLYKYWIFGEELKNI